MVRQNAKTLVNHLATSSKALDRILALEAEVSRLRHHVSVLSKRLHKLDPPRSKISRADSKPSPDIERVILRSESGIGAVEKEGVAEEKPPIEDERRSVAPGVAEEEAEALKEGSAGSVVASVAESEAESGVGEGSSGVDEEERMELDERVSDLRSRISDEDVLVDGKIVPLKGYVSQGVGVRGAPLGPKRRYGRGEFVPLGPYGFRNVVGGGYGGRGRGGGIRPGVAWGGGSAGRGRGGSTGIAWISSGLGTLVPKPG